MSSAEQIVGQVADEFLATLPGYQATFGFGSPDGDDLDLRLCFASLDQVKQDELSKAVCAKLRERGITVDIDLLFMDAHEFTEGIRDLVELGEVELRLKNGFDPHDQQAAVGDTSLFSLYIFATMRLIHKNERVTQLGSPQEALQALTLTREGAVGWTHFYTGCFLYEYLYHRQGERELVRYQERLAKFLSRVILGSVLAQLSGPQRLAIKQELIAAIQAATALRSTDENIGEVLVKNPTTSLLLDAESRQLLKVAGGIRSNRQVAIPADFVMDCEERLFYEAFQQGIDRRPEVDEEADPLTSYALQEFIRDIGQLKVYPAKSVLMTQGEASDMLMYIPLKTSKGLDNSGVDIVVRHAKGSIAAEYHRTAGRVVGEGAIFGFPRAAIVSAQATLEAYSISGTALRAVMRDTALYQQLQSPVLASREARRLDVLLRYFAREAGIFTRQTLPYTSLANREDARALLGDNPLAYYYLGRDFHDLLLCFARNTSQAEVAVQSTSSQSRPLFKQGQHVDYLYVVSTGTVAITLQNNAETITLQPGEYFGESSLLGLAATGTAVLSPHSSVLAVNKHWFKRFTQSRQPITEVTLPPRLKNVLPVHLLYHLAAEGYDRVRRRLITQ